MLSFSSDAPFDRSGRRFRAPRGRGFAGGNGGGVVDHALLSRDRRDGLLSPGSGWRDEELPCR